MTYANVYTRRAGKLLARVATMAGAVHVVAQAPAGQAAGLGTVLGGLLAELRAVWRM
jgi:hypothetical protein